MSDISRNSIFFPPDNLVAVFFQTSWENCCESCGYPLCGGCAVSAAAVAACGGQPGGANERCHHHHSPHECAGLSRIRESTEEIRQRALRGEFEGSLMPNSVFEPILPLRLILLERSSPEMHRLAMTLMDHGEDRRTSGWNLEYWQHSLATVIRPLAGIVAVKCGYAPDEAEAVASRAVGICEVNNYHIGHQEVKAGVRGLFPLMSLMSHSCRPNCRPIIQKSGKFANRVMACVDIAEGAEVTLNYVQVALPVGQRRSLLKENWYFDCRCDRCLDPEDLGSHLCSVRCTGCTDGFWTRRVVVGHLDGVDDHLDLGPWRCTSCGVAPGPEVPQVVTDRLRAEKESLDMLDLDSLMGFLRRGEAELHENHFLLTSVRKWLISLYCRPTLMDPRTTFPPQMYRDKASLCRKYLGVLDLVEPGLTRNRGKALYELASSKWGYLQQAMARSVAILAEELEECRNVLKDALDCLKLEQEQTYEGLVRRLAKDLLETIELSMKANLFNGPPSGI